METFNLAILAYLFFINIVAIFFIGEDKRRARRGNISEKRTSEGMLFLVAVVGGSLGIYAGMFLFRHKTAKVSFLAGIPLLIIQQLLLLNNYFFIK